MFDFNKYRDEQENLKKIIALQDSGHLILTSHAQTIIELFLADIELPDSLKINFSSSENFVINTNEHTVELNTLSTLLNTRSLPFEYWKKTLNPSIFYNSKNFKMAFEYAFKNNNIDFIKESFIQCINLSKNVAFDDETYKNIYMNPSEVPYPVNKIYHFDDNNSYHSIFNHVVSSLETSFRDSFAMCFNHNKSISKEDIQFVDNLHSLENFLFSFLCTNQGIFAFSKFDKKNENYQNRLDIIQQFQKSSDIDDWIKNSKNLNPHTYVDNLYNNGSIEGLDLSVAFYLKDKLQKISNYICDNYYSNFSYPAFYSSLLDKKHKTKFLNTNVIDNELFEEYSLKSDLFEHFIDNYLNSFAKNTGRKKVTPAFINIIFSEVALLSTLFNSDYLDKFMKKYKVSEKKSVEIFKNTVKTISSKNFNNLHDSTHNILTSLAFNNTYNTFKKHFPESPIFLNEFTLFDKNSEQSELDLDFITDYFEDNVSIKLICSFNQTFTTFVLSQTSLPNLNKNISLNYFLSKKLCHNETIQNSKFLKLIDFCDNNHKYKNMNTTLFYQQPLEHQEHLLMELINKPVNGKTKSKPLKF